MIGVSVVFAQEALLKFTDVSGGVSVAGKNYKETVGDITIPDTYNGKKVVAVATNGFKGYSGITGLKISNNITDIGNSAFENCYGIIEVKMGDGVKVIGINAFRGCRNLKVLTGANIGGSVEQIRTAAFENCGALERVWFRSSVKSINDKAFAGCGKINRVNFQSPDTKIGSNSFPDAQNLIDAYKAGGKGAYDKVGKEWVKREE
jgi:hypothetical protein